MPMLVIELAVGQRMQMGFMRVWRSINSRLSGLGLVSVALATLCAVYYNVIVAWSFFYLFNSFRSPLPWAEGGLNPSDSAKKFWLEEALRKAESMGAVDGKIHAPMMGCLSVAWIVVYFCVFRGIKSTGRVVYFTALFPYLGLLILFFRGVTLPGAGTGILYYIRPQWGKLFSPHVWAAAGSQIFYSLGIAWGALVNFASFNPKKNDFFADAAIVVAVNSFTSIFAGIVVFAVVGHMSHTSGMAIEEVARAGSGLAFVVYPAALATMKGAWFFSILFFIMLISLGVGSEFSMVEVAITALIEGSLFRSIRKEVLALFVCLGMWGVGILLSSSVGLYWVDLLDTFTGSVALYVVALCEVLAVAFGYGFTRLAADCEEMSGRRVGPASNIMLKSSPSRPPEP
eukprot:Polyplicarium_translucidae@DN3298_c0_g1_i10.p2